MFELLKSQKKTAENKQSPNQASCSNFIEHKRTSRILWKYTNKRIINIWESIEQLTAMYYSVKQFLFMAPTLKETFANTINPISSYSHTLLTMI